MGYYSRFSGRIAIEPPLPWEKARESGFLPEMTWMDDKDVKDVKLVIEETPVDTAEGVLTRRQAVAVEAASDDHMKGYHIIEHLQELVTQAGPDHTFTGRINARGEGDGSDPDVWRLIVVDGVAKRIEPRLVWPDEDPPAPVNPEPARRIVEIIETEEIIVRWGRRRR